MEYSELTITITNKLSKKEKKDHGIFITPRTIIERLFASLPPINPSRILEPSAGTCEIANYALFQFPHAHIDAVEFNDTIYAATSSVVPPTINYIHADYTRWSASKPYDLIVGNPPYVVCAKEDVPVQYHDYVVGRPNLFCTFMLHSISMLAEGGILAFVIPTSFLNAAYYARLRNYMKTTGTILNIVNFADNNKFIETQQATIGIIFRKEAQAIVGSCPFSVKFGANYVFTENAANIHAILAGSTTLAQMGIRVKTGTIVWNEHKAVITDDTSKTLLIYNTNVAKTNQVVVQTFANEEKAIHRFARSNRTHYRGESRKRQQRLQTQLCLRRWVPSLLGREPPKYDSVRKCGKCAAHSGQLRQQKNGRVRIYILGEQWLIQD